MRWHVISAVFFRNVKQYFSGVLGYLFLVVFVMVCAIMTFSDRFFADNLSNLDQLSQWYPLLLIGFVAAITMTVWAEERRQGTDAILFTLPATDLEIMLGKYFSVAAVYTIALLFSMTQLVALNFIGNPDWGVIGSTYFGYWLAGLALLSIGMFASSLTSSVPVAFVLGALFCSIPIFLGDLLGYLPKLIGQILPESVAAAFPTTLGTEQLGMDWNLQDFTLGLIPLSNVIYFLSIIALMLYLNLVVISRRLWSRGQHVSLGGQFAIRIVSLAIALLAFNFIINRASSSLMTRLDLTAEKLYTLDNSTIDTLKNARQNNRPITVQAFVSRDVPREYVNTKKQFNGLLRQFQYYGGNNLSVRFVDVLPNSNAELEAERLGIEAKADRSEVNGRIVEQDVYLGARVSSTQDDAVIPFVENDSAIEYQLTQSIATTTDKSRRITLGIVDTDTFFAGPTFEGRRVPWAYNETYSYLKTQFKIQNIAQDELDSFNPPKPDPTQPGGEIVAPAKAKTPPDVLLVPDPSSLSDLATKALVQYMNAGNPVVLLADPLPFLWTSRNPQNIGVLNAPKQPRLSQQSPYAQVLSSSFEPKADGGQCSQIMSVLGVDWRHDTVAWNLYDPHPNFRGVWMDPTGQATWPENFGPYECAFVFVKNHSSHVAFNQESSISRGLKELLFFYPGSFKKSAESNLKFSPLVTIEEKSGTTQWDQLTMTPSQTMYRLDPRTRQRVREENKRRSQITGEDLFVLNPTPIRSLDSDEHVVAAHITSEEESGPNVVLIADTDFVSDMYSEQTGDGGLGQNLDNVSLLQNAIEVLAGDEAFVALRNRRPEPRTLTYIEKATETYRTDRARAQEEIEKGIKDELDNAQAQLNIAAKKIEDDTSLSFFEKLQQTSQKASDSQRRFDLKKEKLDRQLKEEVAKLKASEESQVRRTEGFVRMVAVLFAPLPAIFLGILVLGIRSVRENSQIKSSRRV